MAVAKVYNGSSWVAFIPKTYNGSGWEEKPYFYDGSNWVPLFPAGDVITLSGTGASPNITEIGGASVGSTASWVLDTDGKLYQDASEFDPGVEWCPSPTVDYWVRASTYSGDGPTSGSGTGSWLKVAGTGAATRTWTWTYTGSDLNGWVKIELSTDSGGSSIIATGYYGVNIHAAA